MAINDQDSIRGWSCYLFGIRVGSVDGWLVTALASCPVATAPARVKRAGGLEHLALLIALPELLLGQSAAGPTCKEHGSQMSGIDLEK